ncbi:MAG: hypothetical protein KatS3mg131_2781 [Candidatus Tectimicrobiota bacterium]|nr:MAG: hypothetical protein KatS3mg131_2781 [Candidatus Tectomicrobia bacterium]
MRAALVTFVLLGLAALAWGAPRESSRLPFERFGVIDRVSPEEDTIVISDMRYVLPATVRVYLWGEAKAPRGRETPPFGNRYALRPGMHVGYTVGGEGGGRVGHLLEVWILPPHAVPRFSE